MESEDEDVVFGGSDLHKHLIEAGCDEDIVGTYQRSESNRAEDAKQDGWLSLRSRTKSVRQQLWTFITKKLGIHSLEDEENDQFFVASLLNLIQNSPLITYEDSSFLANMLEDHINEVALETQKSSHIYSLWTLGTLCLAVALYLTPEVPIVTQIPAYCFIGSSLLAVTVRQHRQWHKAKLKETLKNFESVLNKVGKLRTSLSKALNFVQEMELISRGFTLPLLANHLITKHTQGSDLLLCLPLRKDIDFVIRELIELTRSSVQTVRETLPLGRAIDNPSHYLACSSLPEGHMDVDFITVQHLKCGLKNCSLLLSELHRRLALCLLSPRKDLLSKLIRNLTAQFDKSLPALSDRLQSSYTYYTAWNMNPKEEEPNLDRCAVKTESFMEITLHSLERHLRATSFLAEELRTRLANDEEAQTCAEQLTAECRSIAVCNDLILTELAKRSSQAPQECRTDLMQTEKLLQLNNLPQVDKKSVPLFGHWEPETQDEVLVAEILGNEQQAELYDDYDDSLFYMSREERLRRKREKEAQSRMLYSELQHVLQAKAAEWKSREAKALAQKGINEPVEMEPSTGLTKEQPPKADVSEAAQDINLRLPTPKFNLDQLPSSSPSLSLQASIAAQVRTIALQRRLNEEELLGSSDSDDDADE